MPPDTPRLRSCVYKAVSVRLFEEARRRELVGRILEMLSQIELDNPGLIDRLETKLAENAAKGTEDYKLLLMTIRTCTGDIAYQRPQSKSEPLGARDSFAPGIGPDEIVERKESLALLKGRLRQSVQALPPDQKDVILKHYWDGKSQAEIGREAGESRQQVNRKIQAAAAVLRDAVQDLRDLTIPGS